MLLIKRFKTFDMPNIAFDKKISTSSSIQGYFLIINHYIMDYSKSHISVIFVHVICENTLIFQSL